MTIAQAVLKNPSNLRHVIQIDKTLSNSQWVNIGAGIWKFNPEKNYPFVDSSLLDYFSVININDIGSVTLDGVVITGYNTLAGLQEVTNAYFWDSENSDLYVIFPNYDEPFLHEVFIGNIYGFSETSYTPSGCCFNYQGRIQGDISINLSRDPLFFGKITYDSGGVDLINSDGYFDDLFTLETLYGQEVRVYFGDPEIAFADYQQIYTGYVDRTKLSEDSFNITINDKRKQLSKKVEYNTNNDDPLYIIEQIFLNDYGIPYNAVNFNTTRWEISRALLDEVKVNTVDALPFNDIIQTICVSSFGIFVIDPDGRYSFRVTDTDAAAVDTIYDEDILNRFTINYNTDEVLSSVRVGYARVWATDTYTYYTNSDYETEVFSNYRFYREKTIDTYLVDLASATTFAEKIMQYYKDVHGTFTIKVPMKFYAIEVTDIVSVEINRSNTTMLGTKNCEVISKKYGRDFITFGLRII